MSLPLYFLPPGVGTRRATPPPSRLTWCRTWGSSRGSVSCAVFSGAAKAKVIRHLETKHKSHDKANAISLPTKFQFNFDDFKVPHDANSQANIVYEVIETVEGTTDETGALRSFF